MIATVILLLAQLPQSTLPAQPPQSTLDAQPTSLLKRRIQEAIAANTTLLVWVGAHDPLVRRKIATAFPAYLHTEVTQYSGVTSGLIVMAPKVPHDGYLYWFDAIPTARISPSSIQLEIERVCPPVQTAPPTAPRVPPLRSAPVRMRGGGC